MYTVCSPGTTTTTTTQDYSVNPGKKEANKQALIPASEAVRMHAQPSYTPYKLRFCSTRRPGSWHPSTGEHVPIPIPRGK